MRKDSRLLAFLLYFAAFSAAAALLIAEKRTSPVEKEFFLNEPAPRTVFSPFRLSFVDENETRFQREQKRSEALPVYSFDPDVAQALGKNIDAALKELSPSQPFLGIPGNQERIRKALDAVLQRMFSAGILEDSHKETLLVPPRAQIRRWNPETKVFETRGAKDLWNVTEARQKADFFLQKEGLREKDLRSAAAGIFDRLVKPNLFYSEKLTREQLQQGMDSVAPVIEEIKRGEMITQKGLFVTEKQRDRLIQLQKKMAQKQVRGRFMAIGLFVFLGLAFGFFYLRQFAPREAESPRVLALIFSVLLLTLGIEKLMLFVPGIPMVLLPAALAVLLLTILKGPVFGLYAAFAITLFSAPLTEFRMENVLMIFVGSLAGTFAAKKISKRVDFLKVGLWVGLAHTFVLMASAWSQEGRFTDNFPWTPVGFANAFLATALAFFLVPVFEQIFNLTTNITLLELSNLNHPILKRMVIEAPGTYHHSLVVSTLAEGACEAIGANALLARVGCYFHDIGKIARSEYFTENQTPATRHKHEKLTPTMSCLVIINHVKDGMELARKYKLKDVIIRFIPEHQGTGVIYFFYKKALDQAQNGEAVDPEDFRYPGPKPQSRETAVAMLADSVEASSRSLKEVTPGSIRALVRKVINEKFIDGQLDECDLTLKDLFRIQESFVHNLMAIFHTRVSYPSASSAAAIDIFEPDQLKLR